MFKLVIAIVLAFFAYADGQATASASASASATGSGSASASASASASVFSASHPAPSHPMYVKKAPAPPPKPITVIVEKPKKEGKKVDSPAVVLTIEDKKEEVSPDVVLTVGDAKVPAPVVEECSTILDAVLATPELSILAAALEAAKLTAPLSDPTLIATVLAPTNDAFEKLLAQFNATAEQVLADPELVTILQYHVIGGVAATAAMLEDDATLTTILGQELIVDVADGVSFIGDGSEAKVITADVAVCNAIVHVIDTVLLPEFGVPVTDTSVPGEPVVEAIASAEASATVTLNI